jgi:hypothetical protein
VARIGAVLHNSLFAAGVKDFFPSCALRRHVSQDTALNSLDVDGVFVIIALPTRTFTIITRPVTRSFIIITHASLLCEKGDYL